MNDQFGLFDEEKSSDLKKRGMELAAENRGTDLDIARVVAVDLARLMGEITSDDVARRLIKMGYSGNLGPAAGSIFKDERWVFTGRRVRSRRIKNHAREIKVWRLR